MSLSIDQKPGMDIRVTPFAEARLDGLATALARFFRQTPARDLLSRQDGKYLNVLFGTYRRARTSASRLGRLSTTEYGAVTENSKLVAVVSIDPDRIGMVTRGDLDPPEAEAIRQAIAQEAGRLGVDQSLSEANNIAGTIDPGADQLAVIAHDTATFDY